MGSCEGEEGWVRGFLVCGRELREPCCWDGGRARDLQRQKGEGSLSSTYPCCFDFLIHLVLSFVIIQKSRDSNAENYASSLLYHVCSITHS